MHWRTNVLKRCKQIENCKLFYHFQLFLDDLPKITNLKTQKLGNTCHHTKSKVHSWQRGPKPPYSIKTPLYYLPTPFFKFFSPPSPPPHPPSLFPVNSKPYPHCFFCCLASLAEWVIMPHWWAILLNDTMDLHMSSLGTLVTEGPWCVFYATKCQVYWGLTHNVFFCWYFDLI